MADDYTDNTATHGVLTPGGQTTGILETANDSDWFKVSLVAGRFYTIDLAFTASHAYYQGLFMYDSQGGYLGSGSSSSANTIQYSIKAASTGDYYIAARDHGAFSASALPYTLKASAGVADDIGDTREDARTLTPGQKTAAVFEGRNDIDYFKIAAQAGVTYVVTPAWGANGSGSVRVEEGDGRYVSGEQSFTATRTGDYYIALGNHGSATQYDVTVARAADDHAANQAGAGRLAVGAAAATGKLDVAGDLDWFGVQLAAGTTYWFTLGQGASSGYYGSGALRVLAEDGTVVATSPGQYIDASSTLLLQYIPTAGGKYYVEVSGNAFSTGTYAVRAELGKVDDHGSTLATAAPIAAGSTVRGELAISDDVDVFKLAVSAGKTYLVALTAQALSAGSGIMLSGQASSGINELASYAKPGVTDYRVLTATTTGDYYISVGATYGRGTGSYDLAVTEAPADDFGADRGTGGTLAVGGTVRGTLDYTGDVDAFRVTLQYGARYAFQLRGAGSGEGTLPLSSSMLQIASTDGSYAYLNDSRDGTYTFTTVAGGDYYLSLRPQGSYYGSAMGDAMGSYTLHAVALNGDTAAPALVSHAPATNAGPLDNITLRFSEAIMRGTGGNSESITLRDSLGVTIETYYRDDSRVTINGDTLSINPSVQLKPGTKYLLSVPNGAVVDLAGNKFAGNALLAIDAAATVAIGGGGNDYLVGLGNGATLSGAGGIDTVIYGYDRGSYDVVRTAVGTSVTKKNWDGTTGSADKLDGVERLMFSDVSVALDIDGAAGQAYRLYRAAFDRAPDKAGIGYWIGQLDNGLSLQDVARGFLASGEFATLYGAAPTDSVFVNKLYQNILHRAPDQAGVDYWLGVLGNGADRTNVLVAFSEGTENLAAALQVIGNGFEYTPYG